MLDETVQDAERPSTPRVLGPTLTAGVQLDHFRIERRIGGGGMGDVYLATDLALDRPVAVKVLSGTADQEVLVREARAQARVHHPNVAHIYYVGEAHDRRYFAMEYVTGQTLADRLAAGPLSLDQTLDVIRAIALGLREADRAGIVHRDIKPSNVMLDGNGAVKILDFGLAAGGTTSMGTPLYLAPERARGERGDHRSDIYSLGVTTYQLLTGNVPFSGTTPTELEAKHAEAPRPVLDVDGIGDLLERMMAIDPADRFASYDELVAQLDAMTARARPAGVFVRVVAGAMDVALVSLVSSLISMAAGGADSSYAPLDLAVYVVLCALLLPRWGRTPGKALLDLEVVSTHDLSRISGSVALMRAAASVAPVFVVWLGWNGLARTGILDVAEADELGMHVGVLLAIAILAVASSRRADKRAWWDRVFATAVRYRSPPRRVTRSESPGAATQVDSARNSDPAPADTSPPRRLDHFVLEERLGGGGMGEVYLATDVSLQRRVALKLLPRDRTSARAREALVREARAQARLQHPNVAHIYFVGEDAGQLYFAMEYIRGESLAQRVASGPMSAYEALMAIREAALGLREAHRAGFLHRDVKPSNLMLDPEHHVKVVDFGLVAEAPDDSDGPVEWTTLGGTPLYMAPEQARHESIDHRADIYALGATLFHLVTATPPFEADSPEALQQLHASAPRPSVTRIGGDDPSLDALIARMMAPNPADRFASYGELIAAIERAARLHVRPVSASTRGVAAFVDLVLVAMAFTAVEDYLELTYELHIFTFPIVVLAGYQALAIARFGTTVGKWLFGLEVVDLDASARPRLRPAVTRALASWGLPAGVQAIAGLVWWFADVFADLPYIVLHAASFVVLAYLLIAARTVPGKRTWWDVRSNTLVRYRARRRSGTV